MLVEGVHVALDGALCISPAAPYIVKVMTRVPGPGPGPSIAASVANIGGGDITADGGHGRHDGGRAGEVAAVTGGHVREGRGSGRRRNTAGRNGSSASTFDGTPGGGFCPQALQAKAAGHYFVIYLTIGKSIQPSMNELQKRTLAVGTVTETNTLLCSAQTVQAKVNPINESCNTSRYILCDKTQANLPGNID